MNAEYEGLNLPQLLELLHPPVEPEPLSWLPQTLGWEIAALWALTMLLLLAVIAYRRHQARRYRREALRELEQIESNPNASDAAARVAELLKRTALARYPRQRVASLWGDEWAEFLIESCNGDAQVRLAAPRLAAAAYSEDVNAAELIAPARRWVRMHDA